MRSIECNKNRIFKLVLLALYILVVAYITVLCRKQMLIADTDRVLPFWSYVSWFHGDILTGVQIVQNIMMLVPFGFILYWNLDFVKEGKKRFGLAVLGGFALSICAETSQLVFKLGTFEFDDLFNNTLGTLIGAGLFVLGGRIIRSERIIAAICAVFVVVGILVCITFVDRNDNNLLEQQFAFQADEVKFQDEGPIKLEGFCFVYKDPERRYELWLKDCKSGEMIKMKAEIGLTSEDVDEYYLCDFDYSHVRYSATADCPANGEYEIFVKWKGLKMISTGEYVNRPSPVKLGDDSREKKGKIDLWAVINYGRLRVCNYDKDCYVYQFGEDLYWIVGKDFKFKSDGSTYIQYQLNTTQIDRLPAERLENGWDWDNIGFVFEENEVTDQMDCEGYRVATRPLPTEYAITAIQTGYYENGKWRWVKYFRPLVVWSINEEISTQKN